MLALACLQLLQKLRNNYQQKLETILVDKCKNIQLIQNKEWAASSWQ